MTIRPAIRALPKRRMVLLGLAVTWLILACSPMPTATPFRPPTSPPPFIEPTLIISPTQTTVVIPSALPPTIAPTVDIEICTNDLSFVEDLTVPDNSSAAYGSAIDKQWLVANTGTCNWDVRYRLRHVGGAVLGAPEEVALVPARAGTQAVIQILFTAPFAEGVYESAWQAHDPNGTGFGQSIYVRVVVP